MPVERSMHPDWLSNAYLAWDEESRDGFFVDSGAPLEDAVERLRVRPRFILRTHAHHDHVAHEDELRRRYGIDVVVEAPGVRAIPTPGHSDDHLCFVIDDICFSGDLLFKDAVGGGDAAAVRDLGSGEGPDEANPSGDVAHMWRNSKGTAAGSDRPEVTDRTTCPRPVAGCGRHPGARPDHGARPHGSATGRVRGARCTRTGTRWRVRRFPVPSGTRSWARLLRRARTARRRRAAASPSWRRSRSLPSAASDRRTAA